MLEYIGSSGPLSLFSSKDLAVIVDTSIATVVDYGLTVDLQKSADWEPARREFSTSITDLASHALDINENPDPLAAGAGRMYTIPGGVQSEAKKALAWRKEEKRGGTPVGINTARTLAKGGQIGIEKIRHIARYFPRHEVDKQGKGWKPGTSAFPSNGRIAWALWGGDSAWRWAEAIVERENKKALAASGYGGEYGTNESLNAFQEAYRLDPTTPEFLARVRMDGSGIDRLYKIEMDGTVYVWDGDCWDTLGGVDGDIYTYDASLDDAYDAVNKDYFIIDPSSAILIAGILSGQPFARVSLEELDEEETSLISQSMSELDFSLMDLAITAAAVAEKSDNVDTPDERSDRAGNQLRDATGKFASSGSRVVISGDRARGSGLVTKTDPATGMVTVKLDGGTTVEVGAKYTQAEKSVPVVEPVSEKASTPINTSGILGKPRMAENSTGARLPESSVPLSAKEVHAFLSDWPQYVENSRKASKETATKSSK